MKIRYNFLFVVIATMFFSTFPQGQMFAQEDEEKLGVFEHLDDTLPNLQFVNELGDTVFLLDIIDKPTIITPVYYECPGICTPLLNGLKEVIQKSDMALATDYQVITFSFDPGEAYGLARKKKNTYKSLLKNVNVEEGWTFLTGDTTEVQALLDALGYQVKEVDGEYIHPAAIIAVSPEGKITRYLNGTYFLKFDFKMAIFEASEGRSGPTINKMMNYCFSYDPEGQTYVFDITKIAGSGMIIIVLSLFIFLAVKGSKKRKETINS
jgi:protein SCO1/2